MEVPGRQGRRKIVVSIELSRDFPTSAPTIRCKYERHTYIDQSTFEIKKTVHAGLDSWKSTNDLGFILQEIHSNVFNTNPPMPMSPVWDSTYGSPLVIPLSQITDNVVLNHIIDSSDPVAPSSLAKVNGQHRQAGDKGLKSLSVADFTAILATKSFLELDEISKNPLSFLHKCESLKDMKTLEEGRAAMFERTKTLEAETKSSQIALEEAENVNQVLLSRQRETEAQLASLRAQLQQLDGALSKQAVCDAMLALAQHEEIHSEEFGTAFSKGSLDPDTGKPLVDLDAFLSKYLASRTLYRLRIDKRAVMLSTPSAASAAPSVASPSWALPPYLSSSSAATSSASPFGRPM